jgi:hypothetical protein
MKIKYMGTADVRVIPIGDMAGGTLPMPLDTEVVWDRSNNWVVDTDAEQYATVPPELWDYLVINDNFQNVSDFRQIPLNDHQRIFLAMKDGAQKTVVEEQKWDVSTPTGLSPGPSSGYSSAPPSPAPTRFVAPDGEEAAEALPPETD